MAETTNNEVTPIVEIVKVFNKRVLMEKMELVNFLGLDNTFLSCNFGSIRGQIENEFNECLGTALYNDMISCLADYSDQKKYNDEETYPVDCVVEHCDKLYIVIKEVKCIAPPNTEYYKPAPKFDHNKKCGPLYEFLYCNYLGPYLANCIAVRQLPHLHAQLTANGIVTRKSDDYQAASKDAYTQKRIAYENAMHMYFNLTKKFIEDCKDSGCFDSSKLLNNGTCCDCGCAETSCGCNSDCEEDLENLNDYGYYNPNENT